MINDDLRVFFNKLLKKIYANPGLAENDAKALASLAFGLDAFLQNYEDKETAADNLLNELKEIAEAWGDDKQGENIKTMRLKDGLLTGDRKYLYLGTLIGEGSEGIVYKISNMPGKLAKIYKDRVDISEKERRLKAFIHNQVPSKIDNILIAAIPEEGIYTPEGKFVGCLMPQISSRFKIYDVLRQSPDRVKYFPELDYRGLIVIAYNLAEVVDCMHRHGIVIGDLNFSNILVNTDGTVCLVDADSFDITDPITQERFPCEVGLAELLAPELQNSGQLRGNFTKATDYFSLAIIIFRLLMNNADPFTAITLDRKMSKRPVNFYSIEIIKGECVYVKDIPGKKRPDWALDFDALPDYIRELFRRVFDYNECDCLIKIAQRPTAEEWMQALMRYCHESLQQCKKDAFHWYRSELKQCPFCKKENVNTGKPSAITVNI